MTIKIQKLKSSKLFYKKWPYKISCHMKNAGRVKFAGHDRVKPWCTVKWEWPYWPEPSDEVKSELLEFSIATESLRNRDDIQIRCESGTFSVFCETLDVVEEIEKLLKKWIVKIYGPETDGEYNFLMKNGHKKILCDVLPHESYRYKIFINPKFPEESRKQFLLWKSKYGDAIYCNNGTQYWLHSHWRDATRHPFIYVKNSKTLSIISLYLNGYVKKMEEYILRTEVITTEVV